MIGLFFSCSKETFTTNPDALLQTSADTLHFDTVFTTRGSVTQSFKIINSNDKGIQISSVWLGGGTTSPFKINVNGEASNQVTNININSNDSAYVFVSVQINPSAVNLPFIVRDSIGINYNGNTTWVQLEAYGQNAHFYRGRTITTNETWAADLPYVILDSLVVSEQAQLTIAKGCRIYMHANAPVIINGSLQAMGEKYDSTKIVFTSNRLDEPYRNYPASWPGLIFTNSSRNNILHYATVKNAYQGVVVVGTSLNAAPKLTLSQTIIDNIYDIGLWGVASSIAAQNVLISNCGKNVVLQGGSYQFTHCTVASYGNHFIQHKDPVLTVTNVLNGTTGADINAVFRNCIFWGEGGLVDNEVMLVKNGTASFNVLFDHVLWKMASAPANSTVTGAFANVPPAFDSINTAKNYYRFSLKEGADAINKGVATNIMVDLEGNSRPVGLPDLGSYERQ